MKSLAISTVGIILACNSASAQTADPHVLINAGPRNQAYVPPTPHELTVAMIRNMVTSPKPLTELKNFNVPRLHRMGDGAALVMQSIMKNMGPLNATEQENVVAIIHEAFKRPRAIMAESNRTQPEASLAILNQLSASTTDFAFRLQIEDTKQFVFDAATAK